MTQHDLFRIVDGNGIIPIRPCDVWVYCSLCGHRFSLCQVVPADESEEYAGCPSCWSEIVQFVSG